MKTKRTLYLWLLFLIGGLVVGCDVDRPSPMDAVYVSRSDILAMNPDLQQVLDYYAGDEEKLRAAEFLIDNLPYHESVAFADMAPQHLAYELFGTGRYSQFRARDSVVRRYGYWGVDNPYFLSDIYINPNFLIDNIDWAFKVWKGQPWCKNVSFEDFCEYILPYRVGNEAIYPWREKIYRQFQPIIDALPNDSNKQKPEYIVTVILDSLLKRPYYFTGEISSGIRVGPGIVETRGGSCLDLSDMLVYVCRAIGVPCGIDYLPMRGDNNAPHYVNFVKGSDGKCYYFSIFNKMARVFPCSLLRDEYGKIYRLTHSLNREMLAQADCANGELHPAFQRPCMVDVTSTYAHDKSWNLRIPVNRLKPYSNLKAGELLYLCMSNRNSWMPVDFSRLKNDTIAFNACHGGVVYCIGKYDAKWKKLTMVTDPFRVEKDTLLVTYYTPAKDVEDVTLLSKFGMVAEPFIWRMVGGVFEGSNDAGFKTVDTLYEITEVPQRLTTQVQLSAEKKYRYVRYKGKDGSFCNVAEVGFYSAAGHEEPLRGSIIGPADGDRGPLSFKSAFDGKTTTSYVHPTAGGGWAGMDLGKRIRIGKITYTPRNRDNFVKPGDTYELFVFKDGLWVSQGKQVAEADSVVFRNIPKHSLLLLRNRTEGVAERIFEYKGGKQIYR